VKKLIIATMAVWAISLQAGADDPKDFEKSLPFSEAVRVDNMLYLSGVIGNVPGTKDLVKGGIAAETRQTMETIKHRLEKNGSDMDHVVKCLVMLADMTEWEAMNEVYRTFFSKRFPARSAMGANGLALGARVEIECMAEVPEE